MQLSAMVEPGHDEILQLLQSPMDVSERNDNNGDASFAKLGPFLPDEIFFEILSWLPVKYLVRCKCVCKQWYNLIENRCFNVKHFSRSAPISVYCEDKVESLDMDGNIIQEKFRRMRVFAGLVSEKGDISGKYRLRNLSTQEIVYLPDPHENTFTIASTDDFSSGEIKLVAVYFGQNKSIEFEFLNLDRDDKWRPLNFPILEYQQSTSKLLMGKNAFYYSSGVEDGSKKVYIDVYSFDMKSECCFKNTLPRGFFYDSSKLLFLYWNGCVAFGDIVEGNLNVIVLEDHKKHKWSETKIVIPLTFLKKNSDMKMLVPTGFQLGKLWFGSKMEGQDLVPKFVYDTQSRKLSQIKLADFEKRYLIRPSVVTFKRNAIGEDKVYKPEIDCKSKPNVLCG
ncbi:hypothetical protein ACOSP7_012002 [Xanthoceras sorbifolium]